MNKLCMMSDCNEKIYGRHLCSRHYQQFMRARRRGKICEVSELLRELGQTWEQEIEKRKEIKAREEISINFLRLSTKVEGFKIRRFNRAIKSAVSRGLEWALTYEQYYEIVNKNCFYCKTDPLDSNLATSYHSTWIDRADNAKGYTLENSVPCCWNCNRIKGHLLSRDEMLAAMEVIKELRGGKIWS